MDYNINIYEKCYELEQKLALALSRIDMLEQKEKKELMEGYFTVNEICLHYEFSRKSFYNYKQIVPLRKSPKTGMKDKYKKSEVEKWYQLILQKKEKTPALFIPEFVKKSVMRKLG